MRNYRRRDIWILLCCIAAGSVLWYFWGPCKIVPIKGSLTVRYADDPRPTWIAMDKCIVVRPPSNLFKLRESLSNYDQNYPIGIELLKQKIKEMQAQGKAISPDASIEYVRLFYKNTSDTPLDWNGKRDEDKEGMEANHRQDLIGVINWFKGDLVKEYTCIKRIDWSHSQRIFFYKDGRTKFLEYIRGDEGKETKEYYLDNWY